MTGDSPAPAAPGSMMGGEKESSMMPHTDQALSPAEARHRALSWWDNEGGAVSDETHVAMTGAPNMTNAALVLLRVRVIALENLLIALLAEGSDRQRRAAVDMAEAISPREGFSEHALTIRAARRMTDMVERAGRIRAARP